MTPTRSGLNSASRSVQDRRVEFDELQIARHSAWLIRLRWVAVAGQWLTMVVAAAAYDVNLPWTPLASILLFTVVTNLWLTGWLFRLVRQPPSASSTLAGQRRLGIVMLIDLISLTGLLYLTGGVTNPFVVFYLVNLVLSAVILPGRWPWVLGVIAMIGLGALVVFHRPMPELLSSFAIRTPWSGMLLVPLLTIGTFAAVLTSSIVLIVFTQRITRQLSHAQAELRQAERERSRHEKLEALGTLAGGAAHELATPLSTIAVVASELSRLLATDAVSDEVLEDVQLIRQEVDHCQAILQRMRGRASVGSVDPTVSVDISSLVEYCLNGLAARHRVVVRMATQSTDDHLELPLDSFAQALRGLLQNALDASGPNASVELRIEQTSQAWSFHVKDQGCGMSSEELSRAGEPFFTTKPPGRGMGLGLFLTRSVVERLGGRLSLESIPAQGTTATIWLPIIAPNASTKSETG